MRHTLIEKRRLNLFFAPNVRNEHELIRNEYMSTWKQQRKAEENTKSAREYKNERNKAQK